jgi:hypothetical protein
MRSALSSGAGAGNFVMLRNMFIELHRTFHRLSESSDHPGLHALFSDRKRLGWDELIQEHRVVLLAEAGSGKTEEIRHIARCLRAEGRAAFFLRLEHVVQCFEFAFEEGSFVEFLNWISTDEEGWLLLDSVDEARLKAPSDFDLAIRKLGTLLTSARQRAHVLITSRASAWRYKTDLALCTKHLPFTRPAAPLRVNKDARGNEVVIPPDGTTKEKEDPEFKIVALDDLSTAQIRIFATANGISDTEAFLDAIERADAWSFTTRPQDLEELIEFWNDKSRIGSRLELMRNSIDRRLTERDQNRADTRPLSNEQARRGAKLIATAVTMAHYATIRVPDGTDNINGLSVKSILNDWNDSDCATLLARPLFDEATYGTVRFHHRSVREYLTAELFADMLQKQTSRRRIEELFFRTQYGLDVIVPVMRPILPWLAIFDEKIRDRVYQVEPEILFEGGDPSQLPLEMRRQILNRVCEQLASGSSSRSMQDHAAVQRIAHVDLTADVKQLIDEFAASNEVLWFLFRIVWLGQLVDALPEAKHAALASTSGYYVRIAAFRAVAVLGSTEDNEVLRQCFLNEAETLDRRSLAELINSTEPMPKTIDWLFQCLRKVGDIVPQGGDQLTEATMAYVEKADISTLRSIIDQAKALLSEPPVVERRHCEVSEKHAWLLAAAGRAVEKLVKARNPAALEPTSLTILHKLSVSRDYSSTYFGDSKHELDTLVPNWPELNLALFWYHVAQERKWCNRKKNERLTDWWQTIILPSFAQIGLLDFAQMLKQISTRSDMDDKLMALSIAFKLYIDAGRPSDRLKSLKQAVHGDELLTARLRELLHPPKQPAEVRQFEKSNRDFERRQEQRSRQIQEDRDQWREHLIANFEQLRQPDLAQPAVVSNAQYYLHQQMYNAPGASSNRSESNWRVLESEFGEPVARAFRDGVVAYWRQFRPKLVSEGASSGSTDFETIFGLTGLAIEAHEVEDWPDTLSDGDAELAFRYAMHELNGFPPWSPQLFAKFPEVIGRMSLQEINYELATEDENTDSYYLLYDVSWDGTWLWDAIGSSLCETVAANEPKNLYNLEHVLKILQGSSISDDKLAELASRKSLSIELTGHAAYWFATWIGVRPEDAIAALEKHFVLLPTDEEQTTFAMIFVTQLLGGRKTLASTMREAYRTPVNLKSLYLFLHRYIRHQEDIDRAGKGAYTPDLRDNAQEARDRLIVLLNDIPGKDAVLALEEISKLHPNEDSRPWFKLQAKAKAEHDADNTPWSVAQVREFCDEQERTPSNHRELFDLAVMRLVDLKDDLEGGDSSNASLLLSADDESEVRKYIGNWCRALARGGSSIPQKEKPPDSKKPDLRWHSGGFDAPVPVELKLADKWTGPELFERLENQLCGDYLLDSRSSRGIYLLVYRGSKKTWELPGNGGAAPLVNLVQALQDYWLRISDRYRNIDDIRVIGIDLTQRSQGSTQQR